MEKMTWSDSSNAMREIIEALAVNRKGAIDLGTPKEKVDEFIYEEAKRQFEKFEAMSKMDMILYMMGRIISKGGAKEMLDMMKGEEK